MLRHVAVAVIMTRSGKTLSRVVLVMFAETTTTGRQWRSSLTAVTVVPIPFTLSRATMSAPLLSSEVIQKAPRLLAAMTLREKRLNRSRSLPLTVMTTLTATGARDSRLHVG